MLRHHSAAGSSAVRSVHQARLAPARYRRITMLVLLSLIIALSGAIGYSLGNAGPAQAADLDDASSVAAFNDRLAKQNDLCAAVEQVNLEQELAREKEINDTLADSLENQKEEMDNLEETILNALMANLTDKLISRSSKTVDAYIEEAQNLISLSRKLSSFKKTEEASEIDLSAYEAAIKNRLAYLPTIKPIPGVYDGYGYRIHPIYGYRHFHPACDVGAPRGTPIKAAAAGRVVRATYNRSSGYYIEISHGNGFSTLYLHCSKLYVKAGDTVSKGEQIGAVGSTGTSTGPHLHYEIHFYGSPLNPRRMIME
ncbi:MAG TPA: hypothetical protein DD640_00230 [Clostridiales bacterium]|nr:hypothetical protein [Clostridiales bacterium]